MFWFSVFCKCGDCLIEGLDSLPSVETEVAKLPMLLLMLGAKLDFFAELVLLIEIAVNESTVAALSVAIRLSKVFAEIVSSSLFLSVTKLSFSTLVKILMLS